MARSLFILSKYVENQKYAEISSQMLSNIGQQYKTYLPSYTNWATLLLQRANPFYEIAISGKDANREVLAFNEVYLPNKMILGNVEEKTNLSLLENKWVDGQTTIYVCENKVCKLPVTNTQKAIEQLLP
jgi:hypothetical protein